MYRILFFAILIANVSQGQPLKAIRLPCTQESLEREQPSLCAIVLDGNISTARQFQATQQSKPKDKVESLLLENSIKEPFATAQGDNNETKYKLGQGQAGGEVFLVVPWDQRLPKYVRKNYFTEEGLLNDLKGIEFLRSLQLKNFAVVKVLQQATAKTLELNYVEGKTINSILIDPRLPESTKSSLRLRFNQMLDQIYQMIFSNPQVVSIERITIQELEGASRALKFQLKAPTAINPQNLIHLIIKSDNIIVDKLTGELVIIDPF